MNTIDDLMDLAIAQASAPSWLETQRYQLQSINVIRRPGHPKDPTRKQKVLTASMKSNRWTVEERHFLEENMYSMTLEELSVAMGRSVNAIKIKIVRWMLERPSKRIGFLTGHKTAKALGTDIHSIMQMYQDGIMPLYKLPGERGIMQISQMRLYMWAVNPEHWIYFKVANMKDKHLQRLVLLAQSRWNDEWLKIGRAAELLGIDHTLLNSRARTGKISAKRWGNWWIKRSDLAGVVIHAGEGRKGYTRIFTPGKDGRVTRGFSRRRGTRSLSNAGRKGSILRISPG